MDDLRIQVNRASDERGAASNTPLKQKRHAMTKRLSMSKPKEIFLAVHRRDLMVYYRRIDAEEYRLLSALRDGQPIAKAILRAFEDSSASTAQQQSMLEEWFAVWAELGWLCPPAGLKRERLTR